MKKKLLFNLFEIPPFYFHVMTVELGKNNAEVNAAKRRFTNHGHSKPIISLEGVFNAANEEERHPSKHQTNQGSDASQLPVDGYEEQPQDLNGQMNIFRYNVRPF